MSTRNLIRTLGIVAALMLCAGLPRQASAVPNNWAVTVTVPTGLGSNPNDLHFTYSGTSGSIRKQVLSQPAGTIGVSGGGNTIDITLNAAASPGSKIVLNFTTDTGTLGTRTGNWTFNAGNLGAVADSSVVTQGPALPGVSPGVLLALSLLLVGAGALAVRRREGTA